jgi:hypothetical protein
MSYGLFMQYLQYAQGKPATILKICSRNIISKNFFLLLQENEQQRLNKAAIGLLCLVCFYIINSTLVRVANRYFSCQIVAGI